MITPLRNQVLMRLIPLDEPNAGGLIQVARLERQPTTRATAVAVGDEVREVEVGTRYVISRLQGIEVSDTLLLIGEEAVLAEDAT